MLQWREKPEEEGVEGVEGVEDVEGVEGVEEDHWGSENTAQNFPNICSLSKKKLNLTWFMAVI